MAWGPQKTTVSKSRTGCSRLGKDDRIILEANPSDNKNAVYDLLDKVTKAIPLTQVAITQVGIKVTFD